MYHKFSKFGVNKEKMTEEQLDAAFVEEYKGALQNIEFAICFVYGEHDSLIDHEVLHSLDVLIREYSNEQQGIAIKTIISGELSLLTYQTVKRVCEWLLGRTEVPFETDDAEFAPDDAEFEEDEAELDFQIDRPTLSLQEIIMCLKRIRLSVAYWNKENGRQGYLEFIENYV